jgi:hypothetical protein
MAAVSLVGLLAIIVLAFASGESAQSVGSQFMAALARGDAKALAQLSHVPGMSKEELEKEWEFTTSVAAKHYTFRYKILGQVEASRNDASVRMQVWRNYAAGGSYEENFPLPMERVDGKWKVLVRGMSRKMYPGLPR